MPAWKEKSFAINPPGIPVGKSFDFYHPQPQVPSPLATSAEVQLFLRWMTLGDSQAEIIKSGGRLRQTRREQARSHRHVELLLSMSRRFTKLEPYSDYTRLIV